MSTKRNIVVCNDKGGVGKSLVSSAIICAAAAVKFPLRGIEAEGEARLTHRYPGVFTHVPVGKDAGALLDSNAEAAIEQFDPIFQSMIEGGVLVDCGANVADKMMTILAASGVDHIIDGDGSNTALVLVTTAELEAIQAAIANAETAAKVMPASKKFLWINELRGAVPDDSELAVSMRDSGFEILRMPACTSSAWKFVRDHSLAKLVKISDRELMNISGLNVLQASRQAHGIKTFVNQILDNAAPVIEWAKSA